MKGKINCFLQLDQITRGDRCCSLIAITLQEPAIALANFSAGYQALVLDFVSWLFCTTKVEIAVLSSLSAFMDVVTGGRIPLVFAPLYTPIFEITNEVLAVLAPSDTDLVVGRLANFVAGKDLFAVNECRIVMVIPAEPVIVCIEECQVPALVEGKADGEFEAFVCCINTVLLALPAGRINVLIDELPTKSTFTRAI
jgi:hypothetical protein